MLKLRWILPRYDIGIQAGGQQSDPAASEKQTKKGETVAAQFPEYFEMRTTGGPGRNNAPRARLLQSFPRTGNPGLGSKIMAAVRKLKLSDVEQEI